MKIQNIARAAELAEQLHGKQQEIYFMTDAMDQVSQIKSPIVCSIANIELEVNQKVVYEILIESRNKALHELDKIKAEIESL